MGNSEYYLGLDMGTNSVGWAVTNPNYELLRFKGKDMWGIREFEEALTSSSRRLARGSRRRIQRRALKIGMLKSIFSNEIDKVDPNFFIRLENSKYHLEDKDDKVKDKYGVFNDLNYSDVDYYKEYPTIFHLRKDLIVNPKSHDIRLVYLAIANMFKHRGNFLSESYGNDTEDSILEVYREVLNLATELFSISFDNKKDMQAIDVLTNKELSRSKKSEKLQELYGTNLSVKSIEGKQKVAFIKCMCGLSVKIMDMFTSLLESEGKEEIKKVTICISDLSFNEKVSEIEEIIGTESYELIEKMKLLHDKCLVEKIMKGHAYLSFARVGIYDKHHNDLKILKKVIKKYCDNTVYNNLFRMDESNTYSSYINSTNSGKKSRRNFKERDTYEFYKVIKDRIKKMPQEDEDVIYINQEIEKEDFLSKQLTGKNGVIPNQIHYKELVKILENVSRYFPFLLEKDETNLTAAERIMKIFTFKMPYYIGPVSENSNGWVKRKAQGSVWPWNIEEKIDIKGTAEEFILRMVRKCTYLNEERVLPQDSLLYEKFRVLNEINNISIFNEKISVELKQEIYNDLFKKGKKVTKKSIANLLYCRGRIKSESDITGIDVQINNNLSSYAKFYSIFGEKLNEDFTQHMVEEIIFWSTIYGETKKFLKDQIIEKYSDYLEESQIKRILGYKFREWGNLSSEFLNLYGCDKNTGEMKTLISCLWDTNYTMIQLINDDKFTFKEELLEKSNKKIKGLYEFTSDDLDGEYFSSPVKRMVWQSLSVIKEIEKIMGTPPKRLFVELARSEEEKGDKGRKKSRKDELLALYQELKEVEPNWKKSKIELINKHHEDGMLKSKKLYLYFRQKGMDMYTGNPIDIHKLLNDNAFYDIDHIYPQHFVKDDNINNNLVLVDKSINSGIKKDIYPIPNEIYNKMKERWRVLREENLISEEKYKRLTRRTGFTQEDKASFISRQLVETRQATIGVTRILEKLIDPSKTTIVYSKASNVAEFRHKFELPKSRLMNDFHHSHDAYLNIVVGNTYYVKFTKNPLNFIRNEYGSGAKQYEYNLGKMFENTVIRGSECAWNIKNGETINIVKKTLRKNTPILSRRNFVGQGQITDATISGHKIAKKEGYLPLKTMNIKLRDVTKYGGKTKIKNAFYSLIQHEGRKGEKLITLEAIPIYINADKKNSEVKIIEYCTNKLNLKNPVIKYKQIKLQSFVKKDGYFMHLSGKTNKSFTVRNAVPLCLEPEWIMFVKKIEKYKETKIVDSLLTSDKCNSLYSILADKHNKGIYSLRPNPMGNKLKDNLSIYEGLGIEDKLFVLYEMLNLSIIGNTEADLRKIRRKEHEGVMTFGQNIGKYKEFLLIHQSVTGLYERRIDLLKL